MRSANDLPFIYQHGFQVTKNTLLEFGRIVKTIFEAGKPITEQPDEDFDLLLQWPFAFRKDILIIKAPPNNPTSIFDKIQEGEPKAFIPTAFLGGGVFYAIRPEHILGCFDARTIKFTPR